MPAQRPGGDSAAAPGRAGAIRTGVRRALLASLGVALVVAAESVLRSGGVSVLLGYSLLLWAVVPAAVTLAVALLMALAADTALRARPAAAVAGLATAAWFAWGVGLPSGAVYGAVLGLGAAGAGLALGARWPALVRVVVATLVATAAAGVMLAVAGPLGS
jgi:hypothetical protein